jgi:nickel superoxide dismutase
MKMSKAIRLAIVAAAVILTVVLFWTFGVSGHCQMPCGIYDDMARFTMLEEHMTTIEKATTQITELSQAPGPNANQLIRWVQTKEAHADELAAIIGQYFLQQRIEPSAGPNTPGWEDYVQKLTLCHRILVETMKAKQTTDLAHVQQLRRLVADFRKLYSPSGATGVDEHHSRASSNEDSR